MSQPPADAPQDDWQVAYVWAFITAFNLRHRIPRLESQQDLELSLRQPVATRPDDLLESTLICFLSNLRPAVRNLKYVPRPHVLSAPLTACSPENIQSYLSNYISDQLATTSEWTVWDRPWPINEENRGSCCTDDPDRAELGRLRYQGEPAADRVQRNPLKRMEEKGGGLFELDWAERARLLRQLVDWQLTHSEHIRTIINNAKRGPEAKSKKGTASKRPLQDEAPSISIEPLGQNRNRQRIWALDDSWRLYRSGNPFKRPCPMESFTHTRDDYFAYIVEVEEYGGQSQEGTKKEKATSQHRRFIKGVQDEKKLAEILKDRVERIEKEEARVQRAKRKIAQALQLQQAAEMRSTRTRRPVRKVDYIYGNEDEDEEPLPTRRSSRPSRQSGRDEESYSTLDARGRPVIPGERRSTRVSGAGREVAEEEEDETPRQPPPFPQPEAVNGLANGKKAPKGYAWVRENVGGEDASPGVAAVDDQQQLVEPISAKQEDSQSEDQVATPLESTDTSRLDFEQNEEGTRLGVKDPGGNDEQTEMKMEVEL
ncbi:hypothetical protein C366_02816 [Cryptococcus neoformans Tu401-1]|nr:hypothetical protein C366_02816 [Cryptococcus neoformans var. grubii Tu401-1]